MWCRTFRAGTRNAPLTLPMAANALDDSALCGRGVRPTLFGASAASRGHRPGSSRDKHARSEVVFKPGVASPHTHSPSSRQH